MTVAEHLAVEGVVKRWHDSLLAKDWNAFAGVYAEGAVLMQRPSARGQPSHCCLVRQPRCGAPVFT